MNENRYTYVIGVKAPSASTVYETNSPETMWERYLAGLILEGQTHLQHEEYVLALRKLREAAAWVLNVMHPAMPADPSATEWLSFPTMDALLEPVILKAAEIMLVTPVPHWGFPDTLASAVTTLPPEAIEALMPATQPGLYVTSFHGDVNTHVDLGRDAAISRDFPQAITHYERALAATPPDQIQVRAGLIHDLAVLRERTGDVAKAQQHAQLSVDLFKQEKNDEGQARALATTAGILMRSGNARKAAASMKELEVLRSQKVLSDVVISGAAPFRHAITARAVPANAITANAVTANAVTAEAITAEAITGDVPQARAISFDPGISELIAGSFMNEGAQVKSLVISGRTDLATVDVSRAQPAAGIRNFLTTLAATQDVTFLGGWASPTQMVAYIPHMYFFILPMSIGDCHAGLGNYEEAQKSYASVLPYPFINLNYEIIKVWTRLAETYLDRGDNAYRNAKDNVAAYATAKAFYENIVRTNKTINAASPLYAHAKFSGIRTRVTTALDAADPSTINDNPAILTIVFDALAKLKQIEAGLNFFGFSADYAPPFSFEYLQNTARYFAQHASQTEQRYIQYKSTAENEELRRDQINQQAEVARETVVLETAGVVEAVRGFEVANASLAYANLQVTNAQDAKTVFDNVRWELLELSGIEAWAGASSVDKSKEVKLSIKHSDYFYADSEPRNVVLRDLAEQRTLISHDMEASRLDRAVASAQSYVGVAGAQVAQANARIDVALQRAAIARLQQRQAEENRDFLDMREFSATLWYEIAQQAKRLKQRYVDMATSVAFLMERAYNAETERGLSVIRYDYQSTPAGNLMGADMLLADIDLFTIDYVTTTKTKKVPVKTTISLTDQHPIQFDRLKRTGRCTFETAFTDFDRRHPGLYLAKIRNVEVVFVGIGGIRTIAGTLRNIGVSRFRNAAGAISARLYPADVMVLSDYEIRQDALAFRVNPNELRLFENNGVETLWQLDLPLDANDFDYDGILDVQLTLYYDGFFDRNLEAQIRAALPASGSASRSESLKFAAPDELFYLKNQGEADLVFDRAIFPRNQKDLVRKNTTIKVTGKPATTKDLTLRLTVDGTELVLKTDANGEILDTAAGAPLQALRNKPVLGAWKLAIRAADNPQLVTSGALDLSGLDDVLVFFEYTFNYR
jgi:hypothetical protein